MERKQTRATVIGLGVGALLVSSAGVATSGTQIATPWLLGKANHAQQTTTLVSGRHLDGSTLKVRNRGGGEALALVTDKDRAPFAVTSKVKVEGLNADSLDGLDATAFEQVPAAPLSVLVLNVAATSVPDTTPVGLGTYFEAYDPSDMHWNVNSSSLMARRTGTYTVSATVTWAPASAGWRSAEIRSPASVVARTVGPPAGASAATVQNVSGIVHLSQGEGVTLYVSQSSGGGPLDATMTAFEMAYVGS